MSSLRRNSIDITSTRRIAILCSVVWTVLLGGSLSADIYQHRKEVRLIGINTAHSLLEKDIILRRWGAQHGGIYVAVTEQTQPNPYLSNNPERDITTPSGKQLTLVNPAYMNRQVYELEQVNPDGYRSHITSLTPLRPENAPDPWEREALKGFEIKEEEKSEIIEHNGQSILRLMRPLKTDTECLKCHASQGYREGDVRGGISISLPLAPILKPIGDEMRIASATHLVIWVLGLSAIAFGSRRIDRTTSALSNERNNFRIMFNSAPVGMVLIDESASVAEVNNAFERIIGLAAGEIIGKRYGQVLKCTNAQPETEGCGQTSGCLHCPIFMALRNALTNGEVSGSTEAQMNTLRNGEQDIRWVSFNVEVVQVQGQRHALMSLDDITDRKRAEESLLEAASLQKAHIEALEKAQAAQNETMEKLSIITNGIPTLIAYIDKDKRYLYVNRSYAAWVGLAEEEIIGRSVREIIPQQAYTASISSIERVLLGEACFLERAVTINGKERFHFVSFYPQFNGEGSVKAYFALITDITEQRQLSEQLRQSQKMDAIGQLASGVAHDFNNILTVITGYCQLMQLKTKENDPLRPDMEQLQNAAERAANLTQSLLSFSRKQPLNLQVLNLNPVLWSMEKFLKRIIGEDIQLIVSLENESLAVSADSGQIQQVMMNLATNARDAMADGGTVGMTLQRYAMGDSFIQDHGYGVPGEYALLSVSDTGRGMDRTTLERLFEPFFTTKEPGKGTGLGLSIVYGIIKQHNGFISVDSEPGNGTTVRIYLPLLAQEMVTTQKSVVTTPQTGNETILVAEDDPGVRGAVAAILSNFEYEVILAEDGLKAVQTFAANSERIHLVLMDIIMPNLNGKEAAQRIRQIRHDVRILFTSGYTADIIMSRGELDSGDELVMIPVKPIELLRKIREVLDR
jgi:PAS domain S-box-containing protein